MLNNLPNLPEFKNLLRYRPDELIDDIDDVVFHLGILSVATASLGIVGDSHTEQRLHDYFAGLLITSAHRINELIGVEGYNELIKAYSYNPMVVRKEIKC